MCVLHIIIVSMKEMNLNSEVKRCILEILQARPDEWISSYTIIKIINTEMKPFGYGNFIFHDIYRRLKRLQLEGKIDREDTYLWRIRTPH